MPTQKDLGIGLASLALLAASVAHPWTAPAAGNPAQTYQVVHGWPSLPDGFAFGQIPGVAIDSHGHVFIFQRADPPVMYLDPDSGEILGSWGSGQFEQPHGLRVDAADNVWATDCLRHQVFKFSHDGKLLLTLGQKGVPGNDSSHFNMPTDVAFDSHGNVFIADGYGNSRVVKYSLEGRFIQAWGTPGQGPVQFNTPHSLTVDSEDRLYVADRGNARIQVFDPAMNFLFEWKSKELGRPWGITAGPDGYLYVVDGGDMNPAPPDRGRVLKLDRKGNILAKWGHFGSYDGQFYWAHAVDVARNGDVYVSDVHLGMRIQKFRPPGWRQH
jgi:peptidylamidoglycolate lyase